jgi:hypothetical protein
MDPRHNAFALGFRLAGPENFLQKFLGTLAQDDTRAFARLSGLATKKTPDWAFCFTVPRDQR